MIDEYLMVEFWLDTRNRVVSSMTKGRGASLIPKTRLDRKAGKFARDEHKTDIICNRSLSNHYHNEK